MKQRVKATKTGEAVREDEMETRLERMRLERDEARRTAEVWRWCWKHRVREIEEKEQRLPWE